GACRATARPGRLTPRAASRPTAPRRAIGRGPAQRTPLAVTTAAGPLRPRPARTRPRLYGIATNLIGRHDREDRDGHGHAAADAGLRARSLAVDFPVRALRAP